jgi:hypothetical protein
MYVFENKFVIFPMMSFFCCVWSLKKFNVHFCQKVSTFCPLLFSSLGCASARKLKLGQKKMHFWP